MNDLLKKLAPISSTAWEEIEDEAKETLKATLAARRVVDFSGPLGWNKGVVETGRIKAVSGPRSGVDARVRTARPLVEMRTDFTLAREEIDAIDRGANDADLDPVREAAVRLGLAEDSAIFHGFSAGDIEGIGQAASDAALSIPGKYDEYPHVVAEALRKLNENGVGGPYAVVLGPRCYEGLTKTASGGFPVINHVQRLIDGPIIRAQAVDGAFVLSLRGGDFCLTVGRDISIGYAGHDTKSVNLYMIESFTFQTLGDEAAIPLTYTRAKKK